MGKVKNFNKQWGWLKIFFHPFPQHKTFWGRNVNQLITVKDCTLQRVIFV